MVYVEDIISADKIVSIEEAIKPIYDRSPIVIDRTRTADAFVNFIFSFIDSDEEADALIKHINGTPDIDCYRIVDYLLKND